MDRSWQGFVSAGGRVSYAIYSTLMDDQPWPGSVCDTEDEAVARLAWAQAVAVEHTRRMGFESQFAWESAASLYVDQTS